ncbi:MULTISPECIES: DUF3012 domain-containing protein [unclassified Methylophaga]|jgi:hypothetical protein|uniref:DUF3012 domain-containing protein n=1 Tax=unclassified Methylophaga TaxID=2629249 RepID=UPI00259CCBD6|nr:MULTISPECIES: DUF3012 domain-containing protein [unclassified Methylophaga]|tara:strand:+ start:14992 stop:15183 length:192 start_codon:yes stop_codon:yes gene_type:complete
MQLIKTLLCSAALLSSFLLITACSPEVGSEDWCQMMKDKAKGDWTANEAADFTRFCIFPSNDK